MWSYEKISLTQIFKSVPVNEENTESYEKISFAHIFNFVSVIEENTEFEPWEPKLKYEYFPIPHFDFSNYPEVRHIMGHLDKTLKECKKYDPPTCYFEEHNIIS